MDKRALRVESPCSFDWDQMTPADKGRFCAQCKKVVHDLSRMSERDARALLAQPRNEQLCVRFAYDKHGQVLFAGDRSPLVPAALLHRAKRAAIATAALVALEGCSIQALGPGGHASSDDPASPDYTTTTGGVAYDPSMDRPLFDAAAPDGAARADGSVADGEAAADAATATSDAAAGDPDGGAGNARPDSAF